METLTLQQWLEVTVLVGLASFWGAIVGYVIGRKWPASKL